MVTIKTIELKNIRSYVDQAIPFPPGKSMLAGGIGTGKSSPLQALTYAWFSPVDKTVSNDAMLRHGAMSGSIKVVFEVDGVEYTIERNLKRSKAGVA
ncbi:MAG: AAA family ATPase, partial [Candidatus Sigynarchaeota archaeon]